MCDCIIIGQGVKLIGNSIFIGDMEIKKLPDALLTKLTKGNPKITIKESSIMIDEWEFKDGSFKKTIRGYIHKWL